MSSTPSLQAKLQALETTLNTELVERRNEIFCSVVALVAGTTVFFLGEPGCLTGDTIIHTNRGGNGKKYRLDELVKKFNGESIHAGYREYSWNPEIPTYVQSAHEDGIRLNLLKNAWCSGVKEVYELRTESGRSIRATDEHPFWTPEGTFARLDQLTLGDLVCVDGGMKPTGGRTKLQYKDRMTRYHPRQRKFVRGNFRVPEHRLVVEADMNGLSLDEYLDALRNDPEACEGFIYLTPTDIVHHDDNDHLNNELSNLIVTTSSGHGSEHSAEATSRVLRQVDPDKIVSIERVGEEMTYDLEVEDDPHNFVANGFVVHNTAKSLLPARLMAYIDGAKYFDVLMTRTTQPEEIFGPPDLKALENGEFVHIVEGYLPWCDLTMIDEIFKANSAILNSFLWAINERKYRHGREVVKIPMHTLFSASNELPQDDSLNALYDRLLFRFEVMPVRDTKSFTKMLQTVRPSHPEPIVTWDEIMAANAEAQKVIVPDRVIEALAKLRHALKEDGIEPSERRFVQSLNIIKAYAWFDECDVVDTDHIAILEHVLWSSPEQRANVSKHVLALANPLEVEATTLLNDIKDLEGQIDNVANEDERMRLGNELHTKLTKAAEELETLQERAGAGKRRSRRVGEVRETLARVTDRALTEVFNFSEEDAKVIRKERGFIDSEA